MYVHNARQAETRRIKNIFRGATAHAYGENSNYSTHLYSEGQELRGGVNFSAYILINIRAHTKQTLLRALAIDIL